MRTFFISFLLIVGFGSAIAGEDSLFVKIHGDTATVWNTLVYANCCAKFISEVSIFNDTITITERDTSKNYCRCLCYFDISNSITGLQAGSYFVKVYRYYTVYDTTYYVGSTSFILNQSSTITNSMKSHQSACYYPDIVEVGVADIPKGYDLVVSYPNPSNPTVMLLYSVPTSFNISIKMFNVLGQEVANIIDKQMAPGNYSSTLETDKFATGVYFLRLSTPKVLITKRLVIVK